MSENETPLEEAIEEISNSEEITVESEIQETEETSEALEAEEVPETASVDRLEALLEHQRIATEYAEFSELFPGVSIASLPDSVNESIRSGVPLAAAYALYHYKKEAAMAAASRINEKNSARSFALKNNDSSDAYFSPAEVREMSAAEVKTNYKKILDSMSHWK